MSTPIGQAIADDGPVGPIEPAAPHEPLDAEEHEEVWAAINDMSERLDHLGHVVLHSPILQARNTALMYAVPLVQDLAARTGLSGDEMRTELIDTVACMQAILFPED